MFWILILLSLIGSSDSYHRYQAHRSNQKYLSNSKLKASIIDKLVEKFGPKEVEEPKNEEDQLLEYLDDKPWRSSKIKNLKMVYRPWRDSWKERYRVPEDESIYQYTIPENKGWFEKTRVDEIWFFPWMWTKLKAERMAWIQKQFLEEVESVPVQEFMEQDAFFAEFDMPFRWSVLRMREFDVLNMISILVCTFTDFNGAKPTDLGLRPDGSVRTCAVQFHNCLSSSNDPRDDEHFAAPFKWDRSKSPDQAYEEVKNIYFKYPKRGLRWSSGWIDRGGWKPQQFSGPYFYSQADSLIWRFTDDIELVIDNEKREVQYRSQTRLGQVDWDVQRLRYNQFVRMLEAKGGWEVAPMERLHWMGTTPYRWTQLILDKASTGTIQGLDSASSLAISAINTIEGKLTDTSNIDSATEGATQKLIDEIIQVLRPILDQVQPITDKLVQFKNILLDDGIIANLVQTLQSYEQITEAKIRELVIPVMDSVSNAWLQIDQSVNIVDLQSRISHFFDNFLPTPEELAAIKDKSASDTATSQPSLLDKLLPKLGLTINEDSVTGDSSAEEAALQQQNQNERLSPQSNGAVSRSFESTSETERGGIVVPREDFQILKRRILESIPPPKKSTSISSSSGTDSIEKRLSSKLYSSLSASAMKSAYADVTFIEDVVGSSAQSSDTEEVQSNANRLNKVRMLLSQRQKARVSSE